MRLKPMAKDIGIEDQRTVLSRRRGSASLGRRRLEIDDVKSGNGAAAVK
jgi:hypothetical protein